MGTTLAVYEEAAAPSCFSHKWSIKPGFIKIWFSGCAAFKIHLLEEEEEELEEEEEDLEEDDLEEEEDLEEGEGLDEED